MLKILTYIKYLLFMFMCLLFVSTAKPTRYVLTWTSINCTHNTRFVRSLYCAIEDPERQHFTVHFSYLRDLGQGLTVNLGMDATHTGGKLMHIMDFDVDVCRFFAGVRNNNFVEIMRQGFTQYGNMTTRCPVKKNIVYGVFNFTVDLSKLPYVPEADVMTTISLKIPINSLIYKVVVGAKLKMSKNRDT